MREIKFLAGLGTILFFAGIYCCKAAFYKKTFKEETEMTNNAPVKRYEKPLLLFFGGLCIILGILLVVQSFRRL